ncbi:GNAT family N-acetyltransferase [Paenibacillus hodogayensis]|uniref:GNAT family N-acetyltransferase n=1 Tax=Paenibacillus hodogayensis TaxID=279208 RepID=A0ABV5VWR4_9BACL
MEQSRVRLVRPAEEYREQYVSFYEEWRSSGEDIVPWVVERAPDDFTAMLDFLYAEDSEEKLFTPGWVPHSTYWLVDEGDQVVGAVNIRHRLNEKLLNSGGHIGYGIRPSARRKGYASVLLRFALQKTKELGLDKVLVVCDKENTGSEKTILKNGGRLESEYRDEDGNVLRRFWIEL